jgi:hypothetical protein
LIVRFWVAAEAEADVLAWLDGKHIPELLAQPGFREARVIRLEETDALGWRGFYAIYGLESKAALDAYLANPIRRRFAREQIPFARAMRLERSSGPGEWTASRGQGAADRSAAKFRP